MVTGEEEQGREFNHRYMAYTPIQQSNSNLFYEPLMPVMRVQYLFGSCIPYKGLCLEILSKLVFTLLLSFMCFVFVIAVFKRGDSVETWIQLSLYLVPLLTFPCGARIFGSEVYNRLLHRDITNSFMVRFFVTDKHCADNIESGRPSAHNKDWLREIALKSLLFPMFLEVIQWGGFLIFVLHEEWHTQPFVGNVSWTKVSNKQWEGLYYSYWSLSFYLVGFVAFQFVFICRIIVKDTVNFMSLFGNSSLLRTYPVYEFKSKKLLSCIIWIANFVTMDLVSSMFDQYIYSNSAHLLRSEQKYTDNESYRIIPTRVLTSPVGSQFGDECKEDHVVSSSNNLENKQISPVEACEVFSVFIAEVEELTSIFTPFTVIIAFLGVANLVTHICLFVDDDSQHLSYWTFFRTLLFLLVAVRMLVCVQLVSSVLSNLPTHVKFRKTSGGLLHMSVKHPSWDDFIELMNGFNLGKRSFGFPLTLRQVASIATFLNMAFLIVLSVFKTYGKRNIELLK